MCHNMDRLSRTPCVKETTRKKHVLQDPIGTKHKTGQPTGWCVDPRQDTKGSLGETGQPLHLDLSPGYTGVFIL